ncbi:MAG: serine/threonine protein kinase, partial [Deltaproteobacteria bacterium]|nr:serine/threonine protein kinase [Deltaproteobacteria bacterium]
MTAAALQPGDLFAGRYRIVRELASGGMGAVFEVVHQVTERRCALKVMLAHTLEREQLRRRFMLEMKLAAQIGSEYVVDVLDAGVDEGTHAPYLVMELLEGEDLGQKLLREGALAPAEAVFYLWHVSLALDRTHQAGIVHRDLKASNLFLTRREDGSPVVKVLDFGVAKVVTMDRSGEQRTQTVGTPIYMAPEQFRGDGRVSPATDIFALGMLSFTLLVGAHYWSEEHQQCENPFAFATLAMHGPTEAPSVRAERAGVSLPAGYDSWFARITSRLPADRFATATEAIQALARALGVPEPQVGALPPPPPSGVVASKRKPASGDGPRAEGGSGRVRTHPSGPGGPSVPAPTLPDGATAQRTSISLSVTSGGLLPPDEATAPRRGRSAAIALGLVAVIAVGAVGIAQPWKGPIAHSPPPAERATAAAPTPSAAA